MGKWSKYCNPDNGIIPVEVINLVIKKRLFWGLICVFALFCSFLNGCGKSPEQKPLPNTQKQESSQKPKEPAQLKDITKEIESIFKEAEKKQEMMAQPGQSENQNKQGQESSENQSGESGGKQQNQQKGSEQNSQKDETENWTGEEKAVQNIHEKWNSLETAVVKAGADDSLITEFETNLDDLTNQVMGKNIAGAQKALNELYGSTIKIADLYQTDHPPQADMMKYFTQKALLSIEKDNWADAGSNAQDLKSQWEKVKTMMDEKGAQLGIQMDYAIQDFDQAIHKENKDVAKIKGEILLSNIEEITKELKKGKEG